MKQHSVHPKNLSILCYKTKNLLYAPQLGPLTRHHLKPKSIGGTSEAHNVSHVPEKLHNAYHLLFANNPIEKIVSILNELVAVPKGAMAD